MSILPSDQVLRERPEISGAHRPHGIFIAKGPGMRQGVRLTELSILDVAPIALHSLGLPVPENLEGHVPEEIFEQVALQERPVRSAPPAAETGSTPGAGSSNPEQMFGEEEESILAERLRQLGYIE